MTTTAQSHAVSRRAFLTIWAGQVVSTVGSGLSGFALGLWVFQQTGRVTPFAVITFLSAVPGLVLAPFIGPLIDRHDRRRVMLWADLGAALCTLAMWALFALGSASDSIPLGWVGLLVAMSASCGAIQSPAYAAAVPQMIERESLGRVNGLVQLGQAASEVLTPALAGALMLVVGVPGILLIDLATFLIAVATMLTVRVSLKPDRHSAAGAHESSHAPAGHRPAAGHESALLGEMKEGWRYLKSQRGLVALLAFLAMVNFFWGMVRTLIAPLILGFGTSVTLGVLISVAGVGMLGGSLAMSVWGGPKRKVKGVLWFELLAGVAFVIIGARPLWIAVAAGVFLAHLTIAFVQGCNESIWQMQVPEPLQGRVFSLRNGLAKVMTPAAVLLAGPLADRVFEPWLMPSGALAGSIGAWIGVGPGRGVALIFVLMGLVKMGVSLWAMTWPELSQSEAANRDESAQVA